MKRRLFLIPVLVALAGAGSANAEVKQSAADGFVVAHSAPVAATPSKIWAALLQPQNWWSGEHTWSGKAANLSLKAEAGGCFCERWPGGSVEHGRVVMVMPQQLLRLEAELGPLQALALKGALTFRIDSADDGATTLALEYRVNGASSSGLDQFAPSVDEVVGQQFARLVRFVANGNPDEPPVQPAVDTDAARRAEIIGEWKKSAEEQAAADKAGAGAGKRGGGKR